MKTYSVTQKTEHSNGFNINLSVLDEGKPTGEIINVSTKDKAYADSFVIGDAHSLVKGK